MTSATGRIRATIGVLVSSLLLSGACTPKERSSPPPAKSSPVTQQASPTNTSPDASAAVTAVYHDFWQLAGTIDKRPEPEWQPSLSKVAVDPQLRRMVQGLGLLREQSVVLYGTTTARITGVEVAGDRATVQDCQDASTSGQAEAKSGKPKTVGVPRNPVTTTLLRGTDRQWRVADVVFGGGACR
ncbi:hypothetical protein [Crossiella sp. CA198]|uniref:hypothetical protein n=1 Tax=Crossiella sp. CA198 TaxID=3455607 RepID=UPI003F8D33E0